MSGQHPPSALPWVCVIEALTNVKEISITTLISIFNKSPKITSDVGTNAREMVSLRILERLFDSDRESKSLPCAPNSGVGFDLSEHCEDVLRHILGEMHDPSVWDKSEKSKWDAQPFIAYKRSCLPKSDLKQLNGTVMEGRPSYLMSLVTSGILDVNGAIFNNQQQSPHIDHEVCQDTSSERTRTVTINGEDEDHEDESIESESSDDWHSKETNDIAAKKQAFNNSNLKDGKGDPHGKYANRCTDVDESTESQSSTDDWYHKEMNDIATKKQAFFSSNCKDEEVYAHGKDPNRCMKCHRGGQLLICSSDTCSFVFHDSCLISTSSIDRDSTGKFYCPFCRYSRSISDYRVVKRKASSARNDLVFFSSSALKYIPKKSHKRLRVSEQIATSELKVTDEKDEVCNKRDNNIVTRGINTRYKGNNKSVVQAWPLRICVREDTNRISCAAKGKTDGDLVSMENRHAIKKTSNECRSKGIKRPLTRARSIQENCSKSQRPNGVLNPDLPIEHSENSGGEGCNEESSEQADHMDHSFQKQIKSCSSLPAPRRRRVAVPWTQLEEETLKKMMQKVLGTNSIHDIICVPWSKILKLGASNFQKGRKPGDLKDKWRNMEKASRNLT